MEHWNWRLLFYFTFFSFESFILSFSSLCLTLTKSCVE